LLVYCLDFADVSTEAGAALNAPIEIDGPEFPSSFAYILIGYEDRLHGTVGHTLVAANTELLVNQHNPFFATERNARPGVKQDGI
jgi:hypothetical protein